MDDLVKGLINVAFGKGEDDDDCRCSETRDERSRSTWAHVVSGEQDNDQFKSDRRRLRKEEDSDEHQESYEDHHRLAASVKHHPCYEIENWDDRPLHRQYQWNEKEKDKQESSDGWGTAQKKHSKRPHKLYIDHWKHYKRPANEQDYSNEVEYSANLEPSEDELADLSRACNKLWELDLNRSVPGKDYEIYVAEGKKVYQKEDIADLVYLGE